MKPTYDTDGQEVTLDLDKLSATLQTAVYLATYDLDRIMHEVQCGLEKAATAKYKGDAQGHYHALCGTFSNSERVVRAGQVLADALTANFYVAEATKRTGEVHTVRTHDFAYPGAHFGEV